MPPRLPYLTSLSLLIFLFDGLATTEIYTLSLHDAIPICLRHPHRRRRPAGGRPRAADPRRRGARGVLLDRKSTRLNARHLGMSYAVFCLKKKKNKQNMLWYIAKNDERRIEVGLTDVCKRR